jgi:hypothetical protein
MKQKFKKKFEINIVPSVIVTVCAVVLICGVYYVLAVVGYPLPQVAPNTPLTATAWNNMVDDITDLNSRAGSGSGGGAACNWIGDQSYFQSIGGCPADCGCVHGCSGDCQGGSAGRTWTYTCTAGQLTNIQTASAPSSCHCVPNCDPNPGHG